MIGFLALFMGIGLAQNSFAGQPLLEDPLGKKVAEEFEIHFKPKELSNWKKLREQYQNDADPQTKAMIEAFKSAYPNKTVDQLANDWIPKLLNDPYSIYYPFFTDMQNRIFPVRKLATKEDDVKKIMDFLLARYEKQKKVKDKQTDDLSKKEKIQQAGDEMADSQLHRIDLWKLYFAWVTAREIGENFKKQQISDELPFFYATQAAKSKPKETGGSLQKAIESFNALPEKEQNQWRAKYFAQKKDRIYADPNQTFIALTSNFGQYENEYVFLDGILWIIAENVNPQKVNDEYNALKKVYRGWAAFASLQMGDEQTRISATKLFIIALITNSLTLDSLDALFGGRDMAMKYMPKVIDFLVKNYKQYKQNLVDEYNEAKKLLTDAAKKSAMDYMKMSTAIGGFGIVACPVLSVGLFLKTGIFPQYGLAGCWILSGAAIALSFNLVPLIAGLVGYFKSSPEREAFELADRLVSFDPASLRKELDDRYTIIRDVVGTAAVRSALEKMLPQ